MFRNKEGSSLHATYDDNLVYHNSEKKKSTSALFNLLPPEDIAFSLMEV